MTINPVQRQRFLLSPEKRRFDKGGLPGVDVREQKDNERQRAQDVRDAARLATLWMRDAIRAIEDLDYVDRVGMLAEGADRIDAVAAELNRRLERLRRALREVLTVAADPSPYISHGDIEANVETLMTRSPAETVTVYVNKVAEQFQHLTGNDALRTEPDVPKPGQHLKSRPSGKPAGLSDRHGGALNPTAAPDGSGPGGGG
ncbi:hypothetical protein CH249_14260 [Rhodococcus sp. 05-2255-3B1]|uniref:hypothetical protein n=1 Tax=unclassified Rhodococcus (in: high G+C Gram-positive bacteria) TaxID=192944 RepID=UPI000B9B1177|nr:MULTISPECIES: hypothetical protein [unclassified Rhodococcus (in: high G+C Gram-positive bacteria)]OZE10240.1 hypothetical protein CH249_14260 [Rhodococcus sp. 05-2255-3B1]OZE13590.1 hypothetical protein CH250_06875 [Rhodococcus sp. 05-2255-3C]OZE23870.1 hypothetical protein CH255_03615 [Rhodococcus sp. 05-2255-2A2]